MIYYIFILSLVVFGAVYIARDKTLDKEKERNCDLF